MKGQNFFREQLNRRTFIKWGGVIFGSELWHLKSRKNLLKRMQDQETKMPKIKAHRILGRTGFRVSDIAMGGTRNRDSNVVRYAYDHGVNYFDSAESYINGRGLSIIGEALPHMDRKKIFITTKLHLSSRDTKETILDRFHKCLEKIGGGYFDALMLHNPELEFVKHAGFHEAAVELKAQGKVRFVGLSSHGGNGRDENTMEKVIGTAAEDGRFDLCLFVYNFMNHEIGDRILRVCKERNMGTTAMKTSPGVLRLDPFDPDNLTPQQKRFLDRMVRRGRSREEALNFLKSRWESQKRTYEKTKPFLEKYKINTGEELRIKSIHWVLQNPDMHTACVSFADFDLVDKVIPLSGTKMSHSDVRFLKDFQWTHNSLYCRHACSDECAGSCPHDLPVSTIMRYAYYFEGQGREKEAMEKYVGLGKKTAEHCFDCDGLCLNACPYGVNVQWQLMQAHERLTLA